MMASRILRSAQNASMNPTHEYLGSGYPFNALVVDIHSMHDATLQASERLWSPVKCSAAAAFQKQQVMSLSSVHACLQVSHTTHELSAVMHPHHFPQQQVHPDQQC
jgi:hypothetical protein